ncbi:DUF4956 domain-containing protein [Desulfococcaceae bacterium HSG7]|nr:DUF4956 domain-containing protein [Desulfococcaceae bacterium HSG7]
MDALLGNIKTISFEIDPLAILVAMIIAFLLSLSIAYTYRATQSGGDYSISFFHTLVITTLVVTLLIIIIGSDIARAFALVGALSVIRFRSAIRNARDLGFIFFSMSVGMACGTRFYIAAILATVFICVIIYALWRFDFGSRLIRDQLLKVWLPKDVADESILKPIFEAHLIDYSLVSLEAVRQGAAMEMVFSVRLKPDAEVPAFLNDIRVVNGNDKTLLLTGQQLADL